MSYSPNFRGDAEVIVENAATTGNPIVNSTGNEVEQLTPVRITAVGDIANIDVSNESAISIAGVMAETVSDGASGILASAGIIKNITTAFILGEVLYISKAGTHTNIKPSIGVGGFVEGDYIIRLGVVGKNEDNPSNKDLHLGMDIVGQL